MQESIKRIANRPEVAKFLTDKSPVAIFVWALSGFVALSGLVGKILDFDKSLALGLSKAISVNPSTKTPELKLWFVPVVLLILACLAALVLLVIWTITRNYSKSKDEKVLDEVMGSVRQIRDQGKQTKIKAWESIHHIYRINKDLSGFHQRTHVIKAVDAPVHFWESVIQVEDEADIADSLAAIEYQVVDQSTPSANIVWLPSENGQRAKKACIFFLPPIPLGESRKFEATYKWPGMFRRLKTSSEDVEFNTTTREIMSSYVVEIYLEDSAGGKLDCKITGMQFPNQQTLEAKNLDSFGWKGSGFIYKVTNIPPGNLQLILKAEIKS